MHTRLAFGLRLAAALLTAAAHAGAVETRVAVDGGSLYVRQIGSGVPAIVLHGGPDFDHSYLGPDLDRLGDSLRLAYYDQRGRGESAHGVRAQDVTLESELSDLDAVRRHLALRKAALLGHSWGTVLALEYALRHPERVSHLILMNPAPASAEDLRLLRDFYPKRLGPAMDEQRRIVAGAAYQAGDPAAVTARYRIHFRPAFVRAEVYERLMTAMDAGFRRQGADRILKARAIEDRLYLDTWERPDYDLYPKLQALRIPTLVLGGKEDFIPVAVAEHLQSAISGAKLVVLDGCGHFSYMECPDVTNSVVSGFVNQTRAK